MYATLLIDLFKFMDPFLRNTEMAPSLMGLYKGTLKVLLVLLHDFPEFLCDYHYGFCDVIPPNCIQMRNLILSAFPRNMRLPDPFTPNLKVDLLAEISLPPRAVINYATLIPSQQFKKDLDAYLKARAPVTFLSELRSNMQVGGWTYIFDFFLRKYSLSTYLRDALGGFFLNSIPGTRLVCRKMIVYMPIGLCA